MSERRTYTGAFVSAVLKELRGATMDAVARRHGIPTSTVKGWKRRRVGHTRARPTETVLRIVVEEAPITTRGVCILLNRRPRHVRQVLARLEAEGAVLRSRDAIPRFKPSLRTKRALEVDQQPHANGVHTTATVRLREKV